MSEQLQQTNHTELPPELGQYDHLSAMVDAAGRKRIYGIDEEGKKHQVKADDVLAAYGYDPKADPDSFERIEQEVAIENEMPVEMPLENDGNYKVQDKKLDYSIEAEVGYDAEEVKKLPQRERRVADKVLKAMKGVEVEIAKEDAAAWNSRIKVYAAGQDILDKLEKEGPDYTPSKEEIEALKLSDHQEQLDARSGKDAITEDDIAYYRSMKEKAEEAVVPAGKANDGGTPLPPPAPKDPNLPPPPPKPDTKKTNPFDTKPKADDLEVGVYLDKDGKPVTDLNELGRIVAEKVANGDDTDFEQLMAVLREAARYDSLNRGRSAEEFEKLFDKFADRKRKELNDNKNNKGGAAVAVAVPVATGDTTQAKPERKKRWKKVVAGVVGAAALVGLGYGGKQVYDELTDNDSDVEVVDTDNNDSDELDAALTGNRTPGQGTEGTNEAPSAEEVAAVEKAVDDRVGEISDAQGSYPWSRAESVYGDQATPRLIEAVEALQNSDPEANAHWVGDPMTSKDAYIVIDGNTDTDYVWNRLAQELGKQDVENFLKAASNN
jgi:hypothetical protein